MAESRQIEIITKAEAARRWGVSAQAVSNYPGKGMPVRVDGRLEWPAVDEWRKHYTVPERSGNFLFRSGVRPPTRPSDPGSRPIQNSSPSEEALFARGACWMAERIVLNARTVWPELTANLIPLPPEMEPPPLADKVLIAGLMSYMIDGWLSEWVDLSKLPPIDFSGFGNEAEAAVAQWELIAAEIGASPVQPRS